MIKFVVVVLLFLAALITVAILVDNADRHACEEKGGHTVHVYKSNLCVSEDGRILE